MRKLTPLLLLLAAAACSLSAESDHKGAEIIAAAKSATGGSAWDAIHIWHETGHALLSSGEASRYEHWADLPSLKTRNASVQGSELHYSIFDGEAAYESTSGNFEPRSALDVKTMRGGAYIACFGFFFPNRFPASFRFDGTRTDHGVPYDVVTVAPRGLDSIDVWVDQKSHRLFRVVYAGGQFHTDLSDYRTVGAITVPFLSIDNDATIQTDSIAFEPAGSTSFSLAAER
jgi:hypothetical protein